MTPTKKVRITGSLCLGKMVLNLPWQKMVYMFIQTKLLLTLLWLDGTSLYLYLGSPSIKHCFISCSRTRIVCETPSRWSMLISSEGAWLKKTHIPSIVPERNLQASLKVVGWRVDKMTGRQTDWKQHTLCHLEIQMM